MRLVCTISNHERENPYAFSYYLNNMGIENQCEAEPFDGETLYRIWVYDEDQVDQATELYQQFKANPKNPIYHTNYSEASSQDRNAEEEIDEGDSKQTRRRILSPAPYGPISIIILFTVIILFILAQFQRENLLPPQISGVIQAPLLAPLERVLLYDYPSYFQLRDHLLKVYPPQQIEEKQPPSAEALKILNQLKKNPVWMGVYDRFVSYYRNAQSPLTYRGPMFEKIGQGEVWRLFTPALLHLDLLHIFFNVLWFILLGNQIEFRLGWFRYLILILTTGIIANTAQYLMSGPFFMGLSGIVVGMAAFIWARQQIAPWEGYLLNRFTLIFLAIFIIGMFLLQVFFFILQLSGKLQLAIGIANTAHLVGGIVGYFLGRLRLFSLHPRA